MRAKWVYCGIVILAMMSSTTLVEAQDEPRVVTRDRARIQAHLAHVEETLREREVTHWSKAQREARLRNLDR